MAAGVHRIPSHATLAFKGKLFEVWQWEQQMFDGSTATFERLKRPDTATIIPVVGDKILMLDEQQPDTDMFLGFPGGRLDEGEEALVAAKRELYEETGYESDEWELWSDVHPSGKIEWTMYTFVARNCRKTGEPHLDAGERIVPRLVSFDDLLLLPDNHDFRQRFLNTALLRARYEPAAREALHARLFG